MNRLALCGWLMVTGATALPAGAAEAPAAALQFNRDIRPILSTNCFQCHGPDAKHREADLRLDQESGIGKAFGGGHLDKSEAWRRIGSTDDDERMPPPVAHKELKPAEIATLRRWIEQGAHWQQHWAFIRPVRPQVPPVKDAAWVRNPIDAFVLARLENEGLRPSPEADRERLLRRVTFDLTGLPPTPKEIDAFVNDARPDAYEKVVDRLLASPHYGERLALSWMDAARYGDTSVFHADGPRDMWPWRDWVIRAFNTNKPFDQFTVEQLAGDEMPGATVEQQTATGFLRNNATTDEGGAIPEEYRVEYAIDRVKTTSLVWLGLTMECGQCHDHKYDPITQREYYQFFAYFNQASDPGMQNRNGNQAPLVSLPDFNQLERLTKLKAELAELEKRRSALEAAGQKVEPAHVRVASAPSSTAAAPPAPTAEKQTVDLRKRDAAYRDLLGQIDRAKKEIAKANKSVTTVMVMRDEPKPRMTYVLSRGSYDAPDKKQPVEPGVPSVLPPLSKNAPHNRLAMARWLVAPEHPLTARVTVNRFWYLFFGNGIVRTLSDFGSQGEPPTHPELLDYLAVDFVEHGWDVKRTLKQIVMSATYRQSSRVTPDLLERDPENRLLARGPRFRLQAEFIRDNSLAAAGLLVPTIGGPSVKPYQPPGLWESVALLGKSVRFVQDHGEKLYRRGMYTYWKRSSPAPDLTIFDTPSREKCTLRRSRTNTPLQALVVLNDPQFVEAARALAQRAIREGGPTLDEQVAYAYRLSTGVRPRPKVVSLLHRAYDEELAVFRREPARAAQLLSIGESPRDEKISPAEHAAMTIIASTILNLDETLTRG